jgi:hypothetical protein
MHFLIIARDGTDEGRHPRDGSRTDRGTSHPSPGFGTRAGRSMGQPWSTKKGPWRVLP